MSATEDDSVNILYTSEEGTSEAKAMAASHCQASCSSAGWLLVVLQVIVVCHMLVVVRQVIRPEEAGVLYSLVFGEGVMNDATSVALLRVIQVSPSVVAIASVSLPLLSAGAQPRTMMQFL